MPQPNERARARTRRRVKKNVPYGIAHIKTSFNNTIVTITDPEGNVVCWESAGSAGFKGSRKSTPFAAQVTADAAARKGMEHGLERVEVHAKGAGSGRDTAIRSLQAAGLQVTTVKDVTPAGPQRLPAQEAEAGLVMARDTGPQCKQCRREGQKLFLKGERCLTEKCGVERRSYPPGEHGRGRVRAVRVPQPAAREAEGAPLLPACSRSSSAATTTRLRARRASPATTCCACSSAASTTSSSASASPPRGARPGS